MSTRLYTSKRRETQCNETKQQYCNQNGSESIHKQRNIPAEIWAKRNALKKLTLQLKFNKSQTHQYKKIRHQINHTKNNETNQNIKNLTDKRHLNNQTISPSNQKSSMRKLSVVKAENIVKYTDNFFASNFFSVNGLKSYHYKSSSFQGNNFINVSKAVILQKNNAEKPIIPSSHRRRSYSHRERNEENQVKVHQRSSSNVQNYSGFDKEQEKRKTDFFKVSSKRLHLSNSDIFLPEERQESSKFFKKRTKTQTNHNLTLALQKRKTNENESKIRSIRPKSCIVKAKKSVELLNCEGWKTKNSARDQQELFPIFFRF